MDITPLDILTNIFRLVTFFVGVCALFWMVRRVMLLLLHSPRLRPGPAGAGTSRPKGSGPAKS